MTDYESLKTRLKETPYLVADGATNEVKLVNERDAVRLMSEAGLFHSHVIMEAGRALENFKMLTGESKRQFALKEIATITGTPYSQVYGWLDENVIVPSIRPASGAGKGRGPLFSWSDAFAAGICGSLRRQGVGLDVLRQVSPLFTKSTTKKKRTRKRATTRVGS